MNRTDRFRSSYTRKVFAELHNSENNENPLQLGKKNLTDPNEVAFVFQCLIHNYLNKQRQRASIIPFRNAESINIFNATCQILHAICE